MNEVIGILMGFLIGGTCRWFDIPVPAPPKLMGSLIVLSITLGFLCADKFVP
ncbi:MAG: DUF1427 family protein [Candidatus Caenarcaniphilales bacterium]|nr:DUF1427 family protein [Candidatus Caenarcaniphilales bacterium]